MLETGFTAMRLNSRMFFIAILVFIFPLLFIWISQSFFVTAYNNIHTAERARVGMVHDVLAATLLTSLNNQATFDTVIQSIVSNNTDIDKLRVYRETDNGLLVVAAAQKELVGTYDASAETLKKLGFSDDLSFQQIEFLVDGDRVWQNYQRTEVDATYYYIFSEFNLSQIDSVMSYRRQQSYFGLTGIFLFLISLAYWVHKQTDWKKRHALLSTQIQERDLFSNMIAHEFRSPLTAIKGYASFLEESDTVRGEENRYAANIKRSAEHLVALVNDFLEVARIQSGKLQIHTQPIDIRTVISTAIENLTGMAKEKGLSLTLEDKGQPVIVNTDESRLLQVLTNVITNAIKYTEQGSVTISYTIDYDSVIIRIMDTGMGISAEDQKKLFAPFTRVGGVDATTVTGTGLGMYITKQLIELLKGTVGVESIKGIGSHIVLTFKIK